MKGAAGRWPKVVSNGAAARQCWAVLHRWHGRFVLPARARARRYSGTGQFAEAKRWHTPRGRSDQGLWRTRMIDLVCWCWVVGLVVSTVFLGSC